MIDPRILGGVFLGWSLGANDAANVFGTAVSSYMVRYRTAAIVIAVFILLGSLIGGMSGMNTLGDLTHQSASTAFYVSLAAGITVTIMTILRIPVSASQAVVGGIIGIGITQGEMNLAGLTKVVICWVGAPIGAALIAASLYPLLSDFFRRLRLHFLDYDRILRALLLVVGAYGAYALGANNVANVTGVFYKAAIISPLQALLIGGLSIGLGAITYSKNVMLTVGRKIIPMDAFTAFVTVFASAITVHIYSWIGVPVSSSQAIVGAVVGVGFLKGLRMVSAGTVTKIVIGWVVTPVMSAVISVLLVFLSKSWF